MCFSCDYEKRPVGLAFTPLSRGGSSSDSFLPIGIYSITSYPLPEDAELVLIRRPGGAESLLFRLCEVRNHFSSTTWKM
jgi:hypothetical protein